MDILLTVFHTARMELVRRICLNIKTSFPWWLFPLFSSLECLNKQWLCKEKFQFRHCLLVGFLARVAHLLYVLYDVYGKFREYIWLDQVNFELSQGCHASFKLSTQRLCVDNSETWKSIFSTSRMRVLNLTSNNVPTIRLKGFHD